MGSIRNRVASIREQARSHNDRDFLWERACSRMKAPQSNGNQRFIGATNRLFATL